MLMRSSNAEKGDRDHKRGAGELVIMGLALSVGWLVLSNVWATLQPMRLPSIFPFSWILGYGTTEVDRFLYSVGLHEYSAAFAERQYDFVADIARASEEDLAADVGVPYPAHRKRLIAMAQAGLSRWTWGYTLVVLACVVGGAIAAMLCAAAAASAVVLLVNPEIRQRVSSTAMAFAVTVGRASEADLAPLEPAHECAPAACPSRGGTSPLAFDRPPVGGDAMLP
eukprot:CAMPEP_0182866714 /NCGR_PEP_ID=MMETSP0034_2-20130328/8344_1 /TAXON_ID=156128 /ORGANISM="Nephroselmis pyriformis, Strain CCMP717" /LENGTH=224 /DNA_ID=CAMNT_0024999043 /DNA_START=135 /DNA_END=809 /DNA_ORIENTATION=+